MRLKQLLYLSIVIFALQFIFGCGENFEVIEDLSDSEYLVLDSGSSSVIFQIF